MNALECPFPICYPTPRQFRAFQLAFYLLERIASFLSRRNFRVARALKLDGRRGHLEMLNYFRDVATALVLMAIAVGIGFGFGKGPRLDVQTLDRPASVDMAAIR